MAIAQGWDGQLRVKRTTNSTQVLGRLTEWSLDAGAEVIEKTAFGDTYDRSYTPGLRGPHTLSFSGYRETSDTGQDVITDRWTDTGTSRVPAVVGAILLTMKTTALKAGFSGDVILTGFSQGVSFDGMQTFSGAGQFAGKLATYSTA